MNSEHYERRDPLGRRVGEEIQIDWLLILLGPWDAAQGCRTGGLVDQVSEVAAYVKLSRRIDSFLLRGIMALGLLKFIGLDHLTDLVKLFGTHT